jgi:hypothetical protein
LPIFSSEKIRKLKADGLNNMSQATLWVNRRAEVVIKCCDCYFGGLSILSCCFPWLAEEAVTHKHVQCNNKWSQYLRNLSKSSLLHPDHETSPRFCPLIHSPDMIWRPSAHDGWSLSWLMPMLIQNIVEIKRLILSRSYFKTFH